MNLETKRNALMNAIASGQLQNIIPNGLTWANGYFTQSGSIVGASATTKEMYEQEYIDIDTTKNYVLFCYSGSSEWCGICLYDSNETFYTRLTPLQTGAFINLNWTVSQPKIRISFSTYGNGYIGIFDREQFIEVLKQSSVNVTE